MHVAFEAGRSARTEGRGELRQSYVQEVCCAIQGCTSLFAALKYGGADIRRRRHNTGGGGQGGISSRLVSVIAVGEAVTRVSDTIGHP